MSQSDNMDRKQRIQDREYRFPYHYIPARDNKGFTQTRHWSWGFRYLGGLRVVLDGLERQPFESLVDIGCGDGRFLREVAREFPHARLAGIDYSERAIRLARAMNPGLDYRAENILEGSADERFEVATAIEVLEHIPPEDLPQFLEAIARRMEEGGRFLLTVPHINKAVSAKHYQHFDSGKLRALLEPHFTDLEFVPFDHNSRLLVLLSRLMGGGGSQYLITNRRLNDALYRLYLRRWLYTGSEKRCQRIAVFCSKF